MNDPFYSVSNSNIHYALALLYMWTLRAWLTVKNSTSGARNPIVSTIPNEAPKKLAIITGSNTGIGFETAKRLVREYGWDVILACRSKDKALIARNAINDYSRKFCENGRSGGLAIVLEPVLDLSDFDSIHKFVDAVQNEYENIDVLINNAGLNTSGRSPGKPDLNLLFQSNYLGHFLLTKLLLENKLLLPSSKNIRNGKNSKVINLSSVMHHFSKGDAIGGRGFESIESPDYWKRRAFYSDNNAPGNIYSASKLAAILHSIALNRRYGDKNLTAIAVNPGAVNSDIWRSFPMWIRRHIFDKIYLTTEEGSEPIIAAAIRDDLSLDNKEDGVIYLQPYANPFSILGGRWFVNSSSARSDTSSFSSGKGPMMPFTEMLGPYVGHLFTIPRLPTNTKAAVETLWEVSEELTKL